jgi:hypothetical protein
VNDLTVGHFPDDEHELRELFLAAGKAMASSSAGDDQRAEGQGDGFF